MIGQSNLLKKIDKLISNAFPRFVILKGPKGSGRTLLSREIANLLGVQLIPIGITVDEVREVINNSYRNTEPILYVLSDTDKMSLAAKNALLKITEEPPQKAYFIQTVTSLSNSLPTLVSRACVLNMDEYKEGELLQYLNTKYPNNELTAVQIDFIIKTAKVPLEIDALMTYNLDDFINFVDMVANNLHVVSSANAFKIEQKLALKKDEDRWDVLLFLQALKLKFLELFYCQEERAYYESFKLVCATILEIEVKNSVNKQYCLDQLILSIRKCWRTE